MTSVPLPPAPTPIDPAQLRRIESTHRGFLDQHLYVVGCLLLAQKAGVREVLVERDEDVELRFDPAHIYIQVKTRNTTLLPSDIAEALEISIGAMSTRNLLPCIVGGRLNRLSDRFRQLTWRSGCNCMGTLNQRCIEIIMRPKACVDHRKANRRVTEVVGDSFDRYARHGPCDR